MKMYKLVVYIKKAKIEKEIYVSTIYIDAEHISFSDYSTGATLCWDTNDVIIKKLEEIVKG